MRHMSRSILPVLCLFAQPVLADGKPLQLGQAFDGWTITRTEEAKGVYNCRAIHKADGRMDIVAARSKGDAYVSVATDYLKGKFPETQVLGLKDQDSGQNFVITAEGDAKRLWFILDAPAIGYLVKQGGYRYLLGGTEVMEDVAFGKSGGKAWAKVQACLDM